MKVLDGLTFKLDDTEACDVGRFCRLCFSAVIALDGKWQVAEMDGEPVDELMDGNDVTDCDVEDAAEAGVDARLDEQLNPDEDVTVSGERDLISGIGTSGDSDRGATSM